MPEKLTEGYEFSIEQHASPSRSVITLIHLETGAKKIFSLAGEKNIMHLTNFMNSLTDDLCSSWFVKKDHKAKNKKK